MTDRTLLQQVSIRAIADEMTYTHAEVRKMLDGISADARAHGLVVVDKLDGTMGLAAAPPAAPAPVVPLTDEQLAKIAVEDEFLLYCDQDSFNEIARAIEAAHGITSQGGGK